MKIPLILLAIGLLLRLTMIGTYTEFLGDQGRDAIEIMNIWDRKEFPLHGPPNSTQVFQGPLYYYLLAVPLIFSNYDPLVAAVFFTILEASTIVFLYTLARNLFNKNIGIFVGLLYALSPEMILRSRIYWNPTPLPLFVSILFLSAYYVWHGKSKWAWGLGGALSCMIQLHYSGLAYLPITVLFLGAYWIAKRHARGNSIRSTFVYTLFGFVATSLPFLIFEFSRGFSDIVSLQGSAEIALGQSLPRHYVMFLAPLPFLLAGALLQGISKKSPRLALACGICIVVYTAVDIPSIWKDPRYDIARSKFVAETIQNNTSSDDFSFVTFASRSASDLHIRFFFKKLHVAPQDYETGEYSELYLLCEDGTCPPGETLPTRELMVARCYEPICNRPFPGLKLNEWHYETSWSYRDAQLYKLVR